MEYIEGLALMTAGAFIASILRAFISVGRQFRFVTFFQDPVNHYRFIGIFLLLAVLQFIISVEGTALIDSIVKVEALNIPTLANSVIGFGFAWFILTIKDVRES